MKKIELTERTKEFLNSIRKNEEALKINISSIKEMLNDYKTMSYEEFYNNYPLIHKLSDKDITEEELKLELKELRKALRELKNK